MRKIFKALKNKNYIVIVFYFVLTIIFFWKFFFRGLVPVPADIIVGVYYPWIDYKWFGFEAGVPVKNPLPSDIISVHYPFKMFAIDQLKSGELPLWNPYSFAGSPLLANFQTAIFYPATILYFFLPKILAWSSSVVLQPFLAATFTYLFLRHLKIGITPSVFGAVAFGFSPFLTTWFEYNIHGHTAAFMPLFLLAVDKLILKPRFRWVILASISFAMHFLAGYPQFLLYTGIATLGLLIFRYFNLLPKLSDLFYKFSLIFVSVVLGFGLSAIQLIPGAEFLVNSIRVSDVNTLASANFGFLPWQNLITFFAPDYFGHPATRNYWGLGFYDNFVGYTGIVVLSMSLFAIFRVRRKIILLFSFFALVALLLALKTPLSVSLQNLNIFGFASAVPSRSLVLLSLATAVLSALGIEQIISDSKNKKTSFLFLPILIPLAVLVGTGIGHAIALWIHNSQFPLLDQRKINGELISDLVIHADYIRVGLRNIIFPGLISALFVIFVVVFRFLKNINYKIFLFFLFILSFADLFRFSAKYLSFSKAEFLFPTTPVFEFLQKQEGPFRIAGDTLPQNFWVPYRLQSALGYDALYPQSYSQFLGALDTGVVHNAKGRYANIENYNSKFIDLLNIEYLMVTKREKGHAAPEGEIPFPFQNEKFEKIFEDRSVAVLKNETSLPRGFLVYDYEVESDPQKTIDLLLSEGFELGNKIILSEELSTDIRLGRSDALSRVKFTKYSPNSYSLEVNSKGDSLLFISDQFYPGWQAFVDDEKTKIYQANYAFRALPVPAGQHKASFIYDPPSFKIGAIISLVTVVILTFSTFGLFLKRNKFL